MVYGWDLGGSAITRTMMTIDAYLVCEILAGQAPLFLQAPVSDPNLASHDRPSESSVLLSGGDLQHLQKWQAAASKAPGLVLQELSS